MSVLKIRRCLFFSLVFMGCVPVVLFAQSSSALRAELSRIESQVSSINAQIARLHAQLAQVGSGQPAAEQAIPEPGTAAYAAWLENRLKEESHPEGGAFYGDGQGEHIPDWAVSLEQKEEGTVIYDTESNGVFTTRDVGDDRQQVEWGVDSFSTETSTQTQSVDDYGQGGFEDDTYDKDHQPQSEEEYYEEQRRIEAEKKRIEEEQKRREEEPKQAAEEKKSHHDGNGDGDSNPFGIDTSSLPGLGTLMDTANIPGIPGTSSDLNMLGALGQANQTMQNGNFSMAHQIINMVDAEAQKAHASGELSSAEYGQIKGQVNEAHRMIDQAEGK
ncbi:MAG: hypothetical protein ABIH47_08290 [Candidatus Omnitrophota bacterium]